MTQRTPSLWESFYFTTVGTVMLMPAFLHWCLSEIRAKLADWDETISAELQSQRRVWRAISRLGDGWVYGFVFFAVRSRDHSMANRIAAACFLAWTIGSSLKFVVRRRRQNPIRRRVKILNTLGSWSFPSQHAAVAVAFACALPNPFTILLAAAICISRVLTGAHYLGDVLAGVAVGLVAGRLA
jgi:undecaprenyl-diphosphatase